MLKPKPKPNPKNLRAIWEKVPIDYYEQGISNNLGQRLWHRYKLAAVKKAVFGFKPRKILDIGANSGTLTIQIAKIFPKAEITGVDIHEKAIEYAQKKYPHLHFLTADAQKLPFKKQTFDAILCLETLEHIVSPQKVLQEIKRCLKAKGIAIVSMDSGNFFFSLIWFFWTRLGPGKVWSGSHLWKFNREKLKKMILKENFLLDKEIRSHLGMAITFRIKRR